MQQSVTQWGSGATGQRGSWGSRASGQMQQSGTQWGSGATEAEHRAAGWRSSGVGSSRAAGQQGGGAVG
jgi:hypothetical protein